MKPMRGVAPKGSLTDFPYLVSPKIDGLRAYVDHGVVYSKTGKPIPNQHVQALFGHLHGADGELTVGPMNSQSEGDDVFARSRGPIMSKDQDADFRFWIFDQWDQPLAIAARRCQYKSFSWATAARPLIETAFVDHRVVRCQEDLDARLSEYLADGYEGAMLRRPDGFYKYGTSTEKEGYLIKLKPMATSTAVILDVEEQQENTNATFTDEQGYTKRSSAKGGKVGKGTFGAFLVRDLTTGAEFSVGNGPGLTHALRAELWAKRAELPGQYIEYRYQAIGTQDAPRLPQMLHFRDPIDISELEV
jgi:DNA ligase-1